MKEVMITMLAMLAMVQYMVHPSEALVCLDVDTLLEPCLTFLRLGGTPPDACCTGLKRLQVLVLTKADRQMVCNCSKSAAIRLQIKKEFASVLPGKCGVSISIPIDPNIDCSLIDLYDESYKRTSVEDIGSSFE